MKTGISTVYGKTSSFFVPLKSVLPCTQSGPQKQLLLQRQSFSFLQSFPFLLSFPFLQSFPRTRESLTCPVKNPSYFSTKLRLGKSWYEREKVCLVRDSRTCPVGRLWPYLSLRVTWHKATIRDGSCVKKLPALRAWAGALTGKLFSLMFHHFHNTLKAKSLAFSPLKTGIQSWLSKISHNTVSPVYTVIPAKAGIPFIYGKNSLFVKKGGYLWEC